VEEPLKIWIPDGVFLDWQVDILHVDRDHGKQYAVILARCMFSGWVEGKIITNKKASTWVKFIEDDIICRYGCVRKIISDQGEFYSDAGKKLCTKYGIQAVYTTAYHPQSNGVVERGHGPLLQTLAKMCNEKRTKWTRHFTHALWADRITVKRSTGYSPYRLVFGKDSVIPVESDLTTWEKLNWTYPMTTAQLLENPIAQVARLDETRSHAHENLANSRELTKQYFDRTRNVRKSSLHVGDIVLLFDSTLTTAHHRKLDNYWLGPYRTYRVPDHSTHYYLEELDGAPLRNPIAGNRLKLFRSSGTRAGPREESPVGCRVADTTCRNNPDESMKKKEERKEEKKGIKEKKETARTEMDFNYGL
jgi:transposase InsO family protein